MLRFKGTWIWPFNPKAMDSKIGPSTLYRLQNQAEEEEELEQEDGEQDQSKHIVVDELINIGSTIEVPITSLFKDQLKYYANKLKVPIITNHAFVIESRVFPWHGVDKEESQFDFHCNTFLMCLYKYLEKVFLMEMCN